MSATRRSRGRAGAEERAVEVQAKVEHLIRLDRAEDALVAGAQRDIDTAEHLLARAQDRLAASKRIDAMEDEVVRELRVETHATAGDVTELAAGLIDAARVRTPLVEQQRTGAGRR